MGAPIQKKNLKQQRGILHQPTYRKALEPARLTVFTQLPRGPEVSDLDTRMPGERCWGFLLEAWEATAEPGQGPAPAE